jgi:hypothetical membrane protein
MDPAEPPAPTPTAGPPERKPGAFVPLAAGGFFLLLVGLFTQPHAWIHLIVFLFFFTALLTARGWAQRVLGVVLSGISGAACVLGFLASRQ